MALNITISQLLAIAVQIETNGIDYYRAAARNNTDDATSQELMKLAAMEEDHRATFQDMQKKSGTATPARLSAFVESLAVAQAGEGDPLAAQELTGEENLDEVLWTAVGMEETSVKFYTDLKDAMKDRNAQETLDRIIAEEQGHAQALKKMAEKHTT